MYGVKAKGGDNHGHVNFVIGENLAMEFDVLAWVVRSVGAGLLGGSASFTIQRVLKQSEKKLEQLRSQPLTSSDTDLEELLAHFVEKVGSFNEKPTIEDHIEVVSLYLGILRAYVGLKLQTLLKADRGRPGGT